MQTLTEQVRDFKTRVIRYALEHNHGNIRKTARYLGTKPQLMQRWVKRLELAEFARDLRRKHAWWLVDRCALVVCRIVAWTSAFYVARPMI